MLLPAVRPLDVEADRDGDKVFENLERRLGAMTQSERVSVIVTLTGPATTARVSSLEEAAGDLAETRRFSLVDSFVARVTKKQVGALARQPGVAQVQENGVVHALNDTAQSSSGVTKARLDLPALDGGDGVAGYSPGDLVAAVVDTGIDPGHQDLDGGKILAFVDCVDGSCAPVGAFDDNGHGTHVAGTIAGDVFAGVAPEAALVGVKVLSGSGSGTDAGVIAGVQWAVANKATYGIEAMNLSLGGSGCSNGTDALSAAVNAAMDAGIVVAVAAGNSGAGTCTISSPGAAANVVTAGAMADQGVNGFKQAYFSSRGKTLDGRIKPDVSAPGVSVTSADAGTASGYVDFSGTSMATPFVAGVSLLMLDANPLLTPQDVKTAMMATAEDWGRGGDNKTAGPSGCHPSTGGADIDYGAGRLDAYAALQAAGAGLSEPPPMPTHQLCEGALSATGATVEYLLNVTTTQFPIAATLIMPSISGATASSPDFDLYLLNPSGTQVAASETARRQDELGWKPTVTGVYKLRVRSFSGSGGYFVDVSAGTGPDTIPPATPAGLTAVSGNEKVTLDWADSADGDLAGYRVYRRNADGSWPAAPTATVTASTHVDSGLVNGTTYAYRVTAFDTASPSNESGWAEASATPVAAPTVKSYESAAYTIAVGTLSGSGAVSRLFTNDGVRIEINSTTSGSPRVSELQPYASITPGEQATLSKLTVNFDAGVSSSSASLSFRVCKRNPDSSCTWETVRLYGTGSTSDRSFTWTTTAPAAYVSASGEIRVSVRGTRNSSTFRTRTDWVRFTIEY